MTKVRHVAKASTAKRSPQAVGTGPRAGPSVLPTPLWADACQRLGIPVRAAGGLLPVRPGQRPVAGRVLPVRHAGSVDVFLEALERSRPGDVLVIDNGARLDEGCIGDLTAIECKAAGLAAIVVWGAHRDTREVQAIGLPVFSLGAFPAGPASTRTRHPDALRSARVGPLVATSQDRIVADADGIVLVPSRSWPRVAKVAGAIWDAERAQATAVEAGRTLREQFDFKGFLQARRRDAGVTFRDHLRRRAQAIEE